MGRASQIKFQSHNTGPGHSGRSARELARTLERLRPLLEELGTPTWLRLILDQSADWLRDELLQPTTEHAHPEPAIPDLEMWT